MDVCLFLPGKRSLSIRSRPLLAMNGNKQDLCKALGIQSMCMNVKENVQQVEVLHRRKGALSLLNPMFLLQKHSQSNSLNARV